MVMTYFNGDEVHQEGKGQREWQVYLISIFLNRAKKLHTLESIRPEQKQSSLETIPIDPLPFKSIS